jgi:CoA-transferase family III
METCAVLDWAASGAMALTGLPEGRPVHSPAPALSMLRQVTEGLAQATGKVGAQVRADPAELLTARAALAGLTRGGRVAAGGSSFLLRSSDGWCALTLSRPEDLMAVPAIIGVLGIAAVPGDEPESAGHAHRVLQAAARAVPAADLADAAQLVGVPAAALPPPGLAAEGWPPWRATRIAAPLAGGRLDGAVVADLSAMWAGPLCARLLGLAGAQVIKVESPGRPDGARAGNGQFFDWLHAGHRSLAVDFGTRDGRDALRSLLESADVVIEASRPRALAAAGLAPGMVTHPAGQVWLSITGYGQAAGERVAFGDDAAVAGGLVGWIPGRSAAEPVFTADAIADPLAGVCGALAVALSRAEGGGERIDLSMRSVAAAFAAAGAEPGHGRHRVLASGEVTCPRLHRAQPVMPPRPPAKTAGPAHAATLGADTGAVLSWLAGGTGC